MTRYPTLAQVGRTNEGAGGGGLALAHVPGVEAALARPRQSAFGEDAFPTLWDKAGALLHGLASTQHFVDGNKRTAWLTAVAFLEMNGIVLPLVEEIQAEAFVLAVSTAKNFAVPQAAEWFEVTHQNRRAGNALDRRVEYMALALAVDPDASVLGTIDVQGLHMHGLSKPVGEPVQGQLMLVMRIHWTKEDLGTSPVLTLTIDSGPLGTDTPCAELLGEHVSQMHTPALGGHVHHTDQVMPAIFMRPVYLNLLAGGSFTLVVRIDGKTVGKIPMVSHEGLEEDLESLGSVNPSDFA